MAEEYDPAFPTGDDEDEEDGDVMATRNSVKKPIQPKETMVVNSDTTVVFSKQLDLVEKAVSFSSLSDCKRVDSSPVDDSEAWPWMIPLPPGEPCSNSSISSPSQKGETEQKVPSSNSISEISTLPEWDSNSNKSRLFNNSVENCNIDLVEVSIVNCNSVDSNKSDNKLLPEDAQVKGIENCSDIPLPLSSVYDTDSCGSHSNSNVPSDSSVNSNRGSKTKFGKFKFLSDNGIDDTSSRTSSVVMFRPDEPSEGPLSNDTTDSNSSCGHNKIKPKEKSDTTEETGNSKQSNEKKESSDENFINSNSNQYKMKTRRSISLNSSNPDSDNQDNSNSETPIIRRSSRIKSIEEKKEREKEQKEKGKSGKGKNAKDKNKAEKDKVINCVKDDKKEKDKTKNKDKDDKVKTKEKGKTKEKEEKGRMKEKEEKPKGKEKDDKAKSKEKEEKPKGKEKEGKGKEEKVKAKGKDDKQKTKEENKVDKEETSTTEELNENEKSQEDKTSSVSGDDVFPAPVRPVPGTSPKLGKDSPQAPGTPQQLDEFAMPRPEKVKSRWRRSSEMERAESVTHDNKTDDDKTSGQTVVAAPPPVTQNSFRESMNSVAMKLEVIEEVQDAEEDVKEEPMKIDDVIMEPEEIIKEIKEKAPFYEEIFENVYLSERRRSKSKKEVRRMLCDCTITKEEISRNQVACGEDCLNRLLMIECGSRCPTGDHCSNKRFQRKEYADVEIFKTELKGWGLRTKEDIPEGAFVMEYVGEVLDPREFKRRVKEYARDKNQHYYFMALKSDEIIDATKIGNPSRFINHSCSPNCETQKWTVNGELRIGFFTRCFIAAGEELTFDYQFQRYGKEAQKCFCGSSNCRGFIGGDKQTPLKREKKDTAPKRRKTAEERKREFLEDMDLEEEIEKLNIQEGLRNRGQTLTLSRLMVRAEDTNSRLKLLQIVQNTSEQACLRLFLDYHGLSLVWSWMVDIGNGDDSVQLKSEILKTLQILPVTNKTMLMDSKVMCIVQRWAHQIADHALKERDSETADTEPSSEPTSQSATPRHSDNNDSDRGTRSECITRGLLTPDRLNKVAAAVARSEDTSSSSEEEVDDSSKKRRRTRRTALFDLPMFNTIADKSDINEEIKPLEEKVVNKMNDLEHSVSVDSTIISVMENNLKQLVDAVAGIEMETKEAANQEFYSELEEGEVRDSLESTDKEVKIEAQSVHMEPLETDCPKLEEKEEGEILEKEDSSCQPRLSSQEGEASERIEDDGTLKELVDINPGGKDSKMVADLAVKLLESWSNLKEAYRIPKREQNQNRREHEREADQHEHEQELLADKTRDRDWEYNRSREHDRDRSRDRNYENDSDWDRDRWDDGREYDRFDREIDKFKDNRKRLRSSPDKDHRHRDKRGSKLDVIEVELEQRPRRPPLLPTPTDVERNGYLYKPNLPIRQPLLPTPPKLSKEERRQLFELKVQQEEAEEAMRKQHEEFLRQQHNSLMLDAVTAPPPLYYEPNFAPQSYYDPNQGYIPPPLSLPGDPSLVPQPPMPIHQLPPPTEPPPTQTPLLPNPTLDTMPPFDPSQPPVVPPFDPSQPPVVYQQGVIYQQSQPSFIPPPTGQGPPPHNVRPPPPVQSYPPPSPAHFIPPVAAPAPAPTPPIYYPPQNVVVQQASPVATPAPAATAATTTTTAFPPPAVVHIPEQTGWTHAHLIPSLPSPRIVEEAPPPPEPPKPKSVKLPPNWKTAKDPEGRVYYYHAVTRQTQWEPPTWDQADDENDMDLGTPTYDEPKSKKKSTTTAAADTSSELAKRTKELFRTKMSQFIVQCLNPYRKPDCKVGRIISTEDFKHLARKLTHFVMAKELKHCRNVEDLECNDNVKHKAKDFVKKYMQKFGSLYRKAASPKDD